MPIEKVADPAKEITKLIQGANGKPAFVDYGSRLTGPLPVVCGIAVINGFFLDADPNALQTLCHTVFNAPSGGVVQCDPIGSQVALLFSSINWVGSDSSPVGVMERSALFHVPVNVKVNGKSLNGGALFTPYIWVDNGISLVGGREVFGYPKALGSITVNCTGSPFDQIENSIENTLAEILGSRSTFDTQGSPTELLLNAIGGNDTNNYWLPQSLITIERTEALGAADIWNEISQFAGSNLDPGFQTLFMDWLQGTTRQIFLKQFPSVKDGTTACLQEITTAICNVITPWAVEQLPYKFDVQILNLDSAPIATDLGFPSANGVFKASVDGGFKLSGASFTLDQGDVLWRAAAAD
jgi:acetoacetate decarboxylase